MVTIPHEIVSRGSHIFGETFFSTKLLGSSLTTACQQKQVTKLRSVDQPSDVGSVVGDQPTIILIIRDMYVILKTIHFCIPHVRSVEERTQEEQSQNREDSGMDT
jgi:hypothetical protein